MARCNETRARWGLRTARGDQDLRPELARRDEGLTQRRFRPRGAASLGRLLKPRAHILDVHEFGARAAMGYLFFSMEFVEGCGEPSVRG